MRLLTLLIRLALVFLWIGCVISSLSSSSSETMIQIIPFELLNRYWSSSSSLWSLRGGGGSSSNQADDRDKKNQSESFSSSTSSSVNDTITPLTERNRLEFLDRIALVSSRLVRREVAEQEAVIEEGITDLTKVTPQSDLTRPGRHIHVVTTAALPWMTGTAVNPLLRAAYLHRRTQEINQKCSGTKSSWVTLVIPWLELPKDQEILYHRVFENEAAQEAYIREWLRTEAGMPDVADDLELVFYPARYHTSLRSIFAMGDIMKLLDDNKMDVCVLEEPEHCNWFRAPGDGWTKRFHYVVGIVHTNYKEYASSHYSGLWTAPAIAMISSAMVRAYCHKVIKLSPVLQTYANEKEAISNVHGVRSDFLEEGKRRALLANESSSMPEPEQDGDDVQVYFIGKLLWAKGLDIMLDLEDYYRQCTGEYFAIDIYGSGPDQKEIMRAYHGRRRKKKDVLVTANESTSTSSMINILKTTLSLDGGIADDPADEEESAMEEAEMAAEAEELPSSLHARARARLATIKKRINAVDLPKTFGEFRRQPVPARFLGRVDHAKLQQYKVFVNPSVSEVLCTTTAEALAMGKFAIIPVHPSNSFFLKFPNCLAYRNKFEFVANLRWALTHEPEPLSPELERQFSWEAATDRFIEASAITYEEALERERLGLTKLDERIAWFHNEIGKGATGDMLRRIFGAGPASHQVRYTLQRETEGGEEEEEEEEEDEDDGLGIKFRRSSFAEAIRATVGDLSSFME